MDRRKKLASRDHILSASLFCGALSGWLVDPMLRSLLGAHIAGDTAALPVLLDLAEERGLDQPGNWQRVELEWPAATGHGHVWLPCESGIDADRLARYQYVFGSVRRCTCGLLEKDYALESWAAFDEMTARRARTATPSPWRWDARP